MFSKPSRREFLRVTAGTGIGFWIGSRPAWSQSRSANSRLNIGVIGVAGQGEHDTNQMISENIVALCDVDERRAAPARQRFPKAKFYTDFRRLLDQKDIDAVLVATPDHTHAVAGVAALKSGRHLYCEKPLAHTVHEVHALMEAARKADRVTQMGTQIHGGTNYRRVVELIRTGAIGQVREVHVWVERAWGGEDLPKETAPVPEGLHYDLWLGPAPERPYHPGVIPANWRKWWDWGGGTLADMGCHYIDLAFWALDLPQPAVIEAEGPPPHPENCPAWLIVRYEFPAAAGQAPVKLIWYHGGKRPPHFAEGKLPPFGGDGLLFVGEKGMMLADYDRHILLPQEQYRDFKRPDPFIPDSIGHYREWIEACKGSGKTLCHFDYSGPLTITVLLGNVAYRSGRRIEWDARRLRIPNAPEAERFLSQPYRKGWTL